MSHYQVLASPSHLEGPYFSMKTSGNRLWWHLWSQKWPRFNGEKSPKMKLNFKVVVLDQNFAFFGLKPNDIKQRSWFWPKIPISQHLYQLDWRHLENQNKSQKCTFWYKTYKLMGPKSSTYEYFYQGKSLKPSPKQNREILEFSVFPWNSPFLDRLDEKCHKSPKWPPKSPKMDLICFKHFK